MLATILALVMALSLCSVSWADGEVEVADAAALKDAIANAVEGATIKLTNDVTITGEQLVIDKDVTLDLNGMTLKISKYTAKAAQVSVVGTVTIQDNSETKAGKICSDYTGTAGLVVLVEDGAKLIMTGGTITTEGMSNAGNALKVAPGAFAEMTGGTIKCDAKRGNRAVNITYRNDKLNKIEKWGIFVMNGGTVLADAGDGNETGIIAIAGSYKCSISISEKCVVGGPTAVTAKTSSVSITGGDISGDVSVGANSITGGTFSANVGDYVSDNIPVASAVKADGSITYVVGSKLIADAANSGDTVTITKGGAVSGIKEGVTITVDKGVEGVIINNVPVEAEQSYTVPTTSTGGYYYYPSTPGITAELNGTNKSATDYPGGDYGLVFRSTAAFSTFQGVQVDGKTLAKSNYTAEEGSTVVYLKAAYLKTLAAGKHTITILSTAGNTSMDFTIGGKSSSPKTFDAGIGIYAVTAVLSVTGMAWTAKKRH